MAADPLAGNPSAITRIVSVLADHQDDIRTGAHQVASAVEEASDWSGASKDRFSTTIGTLTQAAARIIARLDAAIDVLGSYADDVQQIQDEAERIRSAQVAISLDTVANTMAIGSARSAAADRGATEADARMVGRLQSEADDLAAAAQRLDAQWEALVERRTAADRAAAAGLSDTDVLGVSASTAGALAAMGDAAFRAAIAAMPPEVLASQRGAVAGRLAAMSPQTVQAWWDGLGGRGTAGEHAAAQDALITALPAVIGNLNGVPYWARDQANRLSAQRAYAQAEDAVVKAQLDLRNAVGRPAEAAAQRKLAQAQQRAGALENFTAGARTPLNLRQQMPRQMVSFQPSDPPLGAFAVGDLDTAASISYLVPGMGSSLADTTQYMRTASNVQAYQQNLGASPTAMVTWLGYEPPPRAESGDLSVLGEDHAVRGAQNFAADLLGLRAVRPDVPINVVAHSYGSTMASVALVVQPEIRVRSFVTLGSAGIPAIVPDAAATHAEHMYAAQADERGNVAWLGRTFSFPHRADPTQDFGATVIDTTGAATVDLHNLSAEPGSGEHGYLDVGTKTLSATASVTLP